jgi:hypothetical protein
LAYELGARGEPVDLMVRGEPVDLR